MLLTVNFTRYGFNVLAAPILAALGAIIAYSIYADFRDTAEQEARRPLVGGSLKSLVISFILTNIPSFVGSLVRRIVGSLGFVGWLFVRWLHYIVRFSGSNENVNK